jgi:phage-related protein
MNDGIVVESADDNGTAQAIADAVRVVAADDELRIRMATNALDRATTNQWHRNFSVVDRWLDQAFPGRLHGRDVSELAQEQTVNTDRHAA